MDCGKDYILMCEKAFPDETPRGTLIVLGIKDLAIDTEGCFWNIKGKPIPLKSQDQLQEMMGIESMDGLLDKFTLFYYKWDGLSVEGVNTYMNRFASMEQLWLAFVMLTLCHKKWYNGEWRIEDDRDNAISKVTS